MNVKAIVYILSISFQLSGALLLIVRYWKKTESQIEAVKKKRFKIQDETLVLSENLASDSELVKEICINRFAFIYIVSGYFISIFGGQIDYNMAIVVAFVILTCVLMSIAKVVSEKKASRYIS